MGHVKTVQILKRLGGFPQRELQVHMQRKAEPHDVGIILPEMDLDHLAGIVTKLHLEEVNTELTIQVMELIIRFSVRRVGSDMFQPVLIIRAFRVDALPDSEVLPVFDGNQSTATKWALQLMFFVEQGIRGKTCAADFALKLAVFSVVPIKVFHRCSTAGTARSFGDIAVTAPADREEFPPVVCTLPFPTEVIPVFMPDRNDLWKDVCFELLVIGRMGIIEVELSERDVSADERQKPEVLAIEILNRSK